MTKELEQKLIFMWEDVTNFPSIRAIARALDIPRTTVRRRIAKLISSGKIPAERDYPIDVELIRMLKSQNSLLLKQLKEEKARTLSIIESCKTIISKLNIKPVKPALKTPSDYEMDFHALRSDEHVGEKVKLEYVQNLSGYDIDIYKERLETWMNKILLFKEQDRRSHGLNKLVIVRLGDTITGMSAYKGQSYYVNIPAIDQMMVALENEINILLTLCENFSEIESFCVFGNHGRTARKGEHHWRDNWDILFYKFLKLAMKNQPNFKMYISTSPNMLVRHGNKTFFYTHGDIVRAYLGLPYYGLDRTYHRLQTLYQMKVDYLCVGHRHTPADIGGKIISNGSFLGGTELSINQMVLSERPSQKVFYFHPRYGINRQTDLYLSSDIELSEDEEGIFSDWE